MLLHGVSKDVTIGLPHTNMEPPVSHNHRMVVDGLGSWV